VGGELTDDLVPHVPMVEPMRVTGADLVAAGSELAAVEPWSPGGSSPTLNDTSTPVGYG